MRIGVLGTGSTRFLEHWDKSLLDLAVDASLEAIANSNIKVKDVEAVYVGNMSSGQLTGQEHLGAFITSTLGLTVPSFRVEGACASGSLAIQAGISSILSGQAKIALVVGVEKMSDLTTSQVTSVLMNAADEEWEASFGFTFPSLYALMARAHMEKYGTTEKDMAMIAVKNHYHGSLNPLAQFQNLLTVEQVMKSSYVADPLKLLDCSPISDGASVIILCEEMLIKEYTQKGVFIIGTATSVDSLSLSNRSDLTSIPSAQRAAKIAYKIAGLKPSDIDFLEVHDCFTIAEIIALEDLGFFEKGGDAARAAEKGITKLGGKLPVNVSGGLKACGHPVGATGVRKAVEIVQQLRGEAGKRQIKNAGIGLSHNVGGSGATTVVNIFAREEAIIK